MKAVRAGLAGVTRRLPAEYRGRGRVLRLLDEQVSKDPPYVIAPMKLGYRMRVDLRSRTEVFAYYTGRYDTALIASARRLLTTDGVAFDVGANVGFWTVPLALDGARVVAYEPVPSNATRVRENADLNAVAHRVEVREVALSDAVGEITLSLREDFERGAGTGNAAVVIDATDEHFASCVAAVDTLDSQADALEIDRLDVVKLDVEGHEDFVLRGARASLERFRPTLYVEWNRHYYDRRGVDPTEAFEHALRGLDYVVLRRDRQVWEVVDAFQSPRDLDDLVLTPRVSLDRTLASLE